MNTHTTRYERDMKKVFLSIICLFLCNGFLNAQDFRGVKWGMTRQQVMEKETECKSIKSLLENAIAFRCETGNSSLYSSLEIYYFFDNYTVDSLTTTFGLQSILLNYNDATPKLYREMEQLRSTECGNPIKRNDRYYWRSKDKSYVVELSDDRDKHLVSEVIATPDWKFVKDIDFSQQQKKQSEPDWQTVQTFTGTSIETTDDFSIKSKKWRISWTVVPVNGEMPSLFFGAQLIDNDGHSEIIGNVMNEDHGTSVFRRQGTYYLKITASNANWEIEVQEYSKQ